MDLCRFESFPFPLKETKHLLLFSLDVLTDALVGVAGCLARNDCKNNILSILNIFQRIQRNKIQWSWVTINLFDFFPDIYGIPLWYFYTSQLCLQRTEVQGINKLWAFVSHSQCRTQSQHHRHPSLQGIYNPLDREVLLYFLNYRVIKKITSYRIAKLDTLKSFKPLAVRKLQCSDIRF